MQFSRLASALLVLTITLASAVAQADSPASGAALYSANCATNCHGSSPLTSNSNKIYNGRNARATIDAAISNVGDMNSLRSTFPSGSQGLANIAAYLGNTPQTLTFGSTAVGASSAAQNLTVYASLKSGNALSALSVTTSGDFARSGGTCGTTLAVGTSCTIGVIFSPTASGTRSGTLSLTHNGTLSAIGFALSGTGTSGSTAPVAAIGPASLSFASTAVGATSAAQNVTVSNSGNAALNLSSITFSSADFITTGGTCVVPGSMAAGASCTLGVALRPSSGSTGARNATLSIAHNAAGSPGSVALAGTAAAAAAPAAALTGALNFGSVNVGNTSSVQTATLSNTGNAALAISALGTASSEFTLAGGTCSAGGTLAGGASCTVQVSFTPTAAGTRSATLTVSHNAGSGSSTASLTGSGVALSPVASVSPATLGFSQTVASTSAAQTATLSNTGTAPLVIGSLALSGAQAAEYQIATGGTCGTGLSVAANGSCTVRVSFTPAATGARNASLAITHSATGSPTSVTLTGSGTAAPQPAISLSATSLAFSAQTLGSTSAVQTFSVSNSGAATLTFGAFSLVGSAAADFNRSGTCAPSGTLAAGSTCTLGFTFTPGATGMRSATLTIASDAANGNALLSLSGNGAAAPTPAVTLTPSALDFGNQTIGSVSSARSVTLSNSGSGPLTLGSISASAGFSVTHNCAGSLAAGASCALAVNFTPLASGVISGSLTVASNALGSPHSVSLAGSGVTASPVLVWTPTVTALAFGSASVGGSGALQTLVLGNQGPGAVTLNQLTLAGVQAGDFSFAPSSTCAAGNTLTAGASCQLSLMFQPGAAGARAATLQVSSSGTNPPDVALGGTGSAAAQASALVMPAVINIAVPMGAASIAAQDLTVESNGGAALRVTALRVASGSFTLEAAATQGCAAPPFDLMPGQSCRVAVAWSNSAATSETGALAIDTNASATPLSVPVTAVRESAPGMSNAGAGGCSIARGGSPTDPTLWLLVTGALFVLWRRRAKAPSPSSQGVSR